MADPFPHNPPSERPMAHFSAHHLHREPPLADPCLTRASDWLPLADPVIPHPPSEPHAALRYESHPPNGGHNADRTVNPLPTNAKAGRSSPARRASKRILADRSPLLAVRVLPSLPDVAGSPRGRNLGTPKAALTAPGEPRHLPSEIPATSRNTDPAPAQAWSSLSRRGAPARRQAGPSSRLRTSPA